MHFMGYLRKDNSSGVRNHVVVLSTVFCSSTVARRIAEATGTVAVTHEGGCLEVGREKAHTERVLRGVVNHPNVGAILVVGLGCEQIAAESLAQATTGKPICHLNIQETGGTEATAKAGIEITGQLLEEVASERRRPIPLSKLILATQCGGSDSGSGLASNPALGILADKLIGEGGTALQGETGSLYGAAGVMAKNAISPEVSRRIIEITDVIECYYRRRGASLKESNPSPGNIAGGLTTLVEKSLGGACKGGSTKIQGVVRPAEAVLGKGLWVMDTSLGTDTHATCDMVAGGAQIVAFTTGRGTPVGCAIAPVIKITATKETIENMGENIDFDASAVLRGAETIEECGRRLFLEFMRVANGGLTKAEKLNHHEFAIGKLPVE